MMDEVSMRERVEPLSKREYVVLGLMARGLSDREIAEQLKLSLNTVKWHARRVYSKLHVSRRTQAVALSRTLGLIGRDQDDDELPGSPLPTPPTPLVGRSGEIDAVNRLLDDKDVRLLTILGPGGIGKTRLVLAVAADRQRRMGQVVYFVSLQAVPSPEYLVTTIAGAIGFQFGASGEPGKQLLHGLSGMHALLVLDNFEHLGEVAVFVARMLQTAPALSIVVTSRERLNLQAETVFIIDGLAYSADLQSVEDYGAIRLFIQTARRMRPAFSPGNTDLASIVSICRMVEGMPLAIELAAGWVDLLTPAEIAHELEHGLALLATQMRDVPDRHRSMRAVFEHSWRLLDSNEREVFKRLSVFRGGFSRAAAEAVAGATLSTIDTLAGKSLLAVVDEDRYRLHELLRQFGEDKLSENPAEYNQAIDQHCHYYGTLLHEYEEDFKTSAASIVIRLSRLQPDYDNILAGWHHALNKPLAVECGVYVVGMSMLFAMHGQFAEGMRTLHQMLRQDDASSGCTNAADRLRALALSGWFSDTISQYQQGRILFQEALQFSEACPEILDEAPHVVGLMLNFASWNALFTSDISLARGLLKRSLALNRDIHFEFGIWQAETVQGEIEVAAGDYEAAYSMHYQSLESARIFDDISIILCSLALVAGDCALLGEQERACDLLRQMLDMSRRFLIADALCLALISVALIQGQPATTLDTLAALRHHPQCGGLSRLRIEVLLHRYRDLLPADTVSTALDKASKGQLFTSLLKSHFVVDASLIDRLMSLLETG